MRASAARLALGILILLALWQSVVWMAFVPVEYFPGPGAVYDALVASLKRGEITRAVALTFSRALLGLIGAVILGLALALFCARYQWMGQAMAPVADLFRSLPPAAITPVSIFFLGLGWKLYAFILIFACIWPVYLNALAALNAVPTQQLASARVYGWEGWSRMLKVQLRAALPDTFIGIRLASAVSLLAAIVAEMLTGRDGLGYLMTSAAFSLRIPDTFLGLAAAMACGLTMNQLVLWVRGRVIGWHVQMTSMHRA